MNKGDAQLPLISYFEQTLGKPLTTVLLSGYGEEKSPISYVYNIETLNTSTKSKSTHKLVITSDTYEHLPIGIEPLVLLSILKLHLNTEDSPLSAQPYLFEIFNCFEWEGADRAYFIIQEILRKYYRLTIETCSLIEFQGTNKTVVETEKIRLINSLSLFNEELPVDTVVALDVMFNEEFINGISQKRLACIEWNNIVSFRTDKLLG